MTINTQPLLATQPASPVPPRNTEASRLLRVWVDLASRAAAACAHDTEDEDSLRDMQVQVEQALLERSLISQDQLDAMTWWESTLIHVLPQVSVQACLICRKARLGLPMDLPLPPVSGGNR